MIDLQPVPVPELSPEWMDSRESALVEAFSHGQRRPIRWVALAGASGVAASVATLALIGGSPQSAFAGWSATPTPPASGQLTSAVSGCQGAIAQVPPNVNKAVNPSSLIPEVTDVRGPFTVTVFGQQGQDELVCLASLDNASLRWMGPPSAPVGPGVIAVDRVSYGARDGQSYSLAVGRTGAGVTGVTLSLGDGSQVTATTGNGVFVAWWPGSHSITSAAVVTATGVTTQPLDLTGPGASSTPGTKSAPPPSGSQSSSGSSNNSTVCLIHSCGGTGG